MVASLAIPKSDRTRSPDLDRLTVERCRRQDHAAYRTFVERYQTLVFAVVSRIVGRGKVPIVEELSQETFVRAFVAFPGFDPQGAAKLSTWLLTIATRLAIDHQRKHSTWREFATEHLPEVPSTHAADDWVRARDLQRRFEVSVAEMPPEYRAALVLRLYHEQSYEEIAQALKIDLGTVKSRINRAKKRLRSDLELS